MICFAFVSVYLELKDIDQHVSHKGSMMFAVANRPFTQYRHGIARALLYMLLLHGCQSQTRMNGLEEDAPSAASPKPGGKQQGSSEALVPILGSSTPKTSDEQGDAKPPAKRKRGDEDDTKLPAKRPFLDLDAKLVELNEKENKSGRGREWVLGPSIQLPSSEGEHTCTWDIPEGYSFFTHKLIGNNTDDAKVVIGHNRDNYSCVDKSSFKKYKSNEGQVSVGGQEGVPSEAKLAHNSTDGQEEEKVASRNNASLTITVSRKTKIGDELLSGHNRKYDGDAGLLEIQVLLCLEKASSLDKSLYQNPPRLRNYILKAPSLHLNEPYIPRPDEEDQMRIALNSPGGVCIIKGPGGSGKSTLAYRHAIENRNKDTLIWFVQASVQDVLLSEFQSIAREGGIDYQVLAKEHQKDVSMHLKALMNKIYSTVGADQQAFLILDNAKELGLLRDCIALGRQYERIKLIITTRDDTFPNYHGSQPVELVDFSLPEAHAYTTERLSSGKRRFSSKTRLGGDAQTLVSEVGRLPKKLELATSYIVDRVRLSVQGYIEKLQAAKRAADSSYPQVYPEVQLGLDELPAQSQLVMRYSTYMDSSLIPLSLLGALLEEPNPDSLDAILEPLEGLSLIRTIYDDDNTPIGIQIHQEVQDSCRYYRGWSEEANESEATLLGHLVDVLVDKMPWVESNPDDRWVVARLYAPQAAQVLKGAPALLGTAPEAARLLSLMGQYRSEVDCFYAQGLEYQEQALAMRKALYPEQNHPHIASSLNNVGFAHETLGDDKKGFEYYKLALGMRKELYHDQNHPDVASSLNNVGGAYQTLGDDKKGLEYHELALAMCQALYPGQNHPDVANSLGNVGIAYQTLGDAKKGLEYKEQALAMCQALYPEQNHPDVAMSLNNVGSAYQNLGDDKKGLEYHELALGMFQALYPDQNHPDVARSLYSVGNSYLQLGEARKAITYYDQATKVLPEEQRELKRGIYHNLGCMYHIETIHAEQAEDQQAYYHKAAEAFETAIATCNEPHAGIMTEYANFLIATSKLTQAYDYLTRAIGSGDTKSELSYGSLVQAIVSPVLQERIAQYGRLEMRAIDYAYYLLIHHYAAFEKSGITPDKFKEDYLEDYAKSIEARPGQPGKEKQDELAHWLLDSPRNDELTSMAHCCIS